MVKIYRFTMYDISTDQTRISRRWGTREGIEAIGGAILEDTGIEVGDADATSDMPGLTEIGFDPRPRTGFQTQVFPNMRSS